MTTTTTLTPLRYTTPTVTLEVMAREAAVSQWSTLPVVQVWRYHLTIQTGAEASEAIEIRGDRATFIPLTEAIQHYIHHQLQGSNPPVPSPAPGDFHWEPQGLTRHRLHLGPLRTTQGEPTVTLGSVQLADLGEVLDQLDGTVRCLPVAVAARGRSPWRVWGTAAASMVAAIGVTTTLWSTYQSPQGSPTALESLKSEPSLEMEDRLETAAPNAEPEADVDTAASAPPAAANETPADEAPAVKQTPGPTPLPDPAIAGRPEAATKRPSPPPSIPVPTARGAGTAPPDAAMADPFANAPATDVAPAPGAASRHAPAATLGAPQPESASAPAVARERDPVDLATLAAQLTATWEPAADLAQPLTYVLTLGPQGAVLAIEPEDEAAQTDRDQVPLPAIGTLIQRPNEVTQLRLAFHPDGSVTIAPVVAAP